MPGRPAVEQALRFGSYHLRLPAGDDARVSIGARTLTGRAYEGHVFWDTEIFMLPFYLHTEPALARKLLLYRHHTLDGARRRARELGYRGACFAWESTVTGDDVTPTKIVLKSTGKEIPIFTGSQQVHVTADIAYAVWRYWEATLDEDFLANAGAELLFETARFWVSRMTRGERHHHIRGCHGPGRIPPCGERQRLYQLDGPLQPGACGMGGAALRTQQGGSRRNGARWPARCIARRPAPTA